MFTICTAYFITVFSSECNCHLDHNPSIIHTCQKECELRVLDGKRTFVIYQYNYKCTKTQSSNLPFSDNLY